MGSLAASTSGTPTKPSASPIYFAIHAAGPFALPSSSTANWGTLVRQCRDAQNALSIVCSGALCTASDVVMACTIVLRLQR